MINIFCSRARFFTPPSPINVVNHDRGIVFSEEKYFASHRKSRNYQLPVETGHRRIHQNKLAGETVVNLTRFSASPNGKQLVLHCKHFEISAAPHHAGHVGPLVSHVIVRFNSVHEVPNITNTIFSETAADDGASLKDGAARLASRFVHPGHLFATSGFRVVFNARVYGTQHF